jgi:hypothetical protein
MFAPVTTHSRDRKSSPPGSLFKSSVSSSFKYQLFFDNCEFFWNFVIYGLGILFELTFCFALYFTLSKIY